MIARAIAGVFGVIVFVGGCSETGPCWTWVTTSISSACESQYESARREHRVIDEHLSDLQNKCFESFREHTGDYDLFFVEFDDQGWLANRDQLLALTKCLNYLIQSDQPDGKPCEPVDDAIPVSNDRQPLSIIVYVHGWHHSAAPNDQDVKNFRKLLHNASLVESDLCAIKRNKIQNTSVSKLESACVDGGHVDFPWQKKRRVVGIYVGWRGDSAFPGVPLLNLGSVWDRKLAAEKVAHGAVQELFAMLHDFYLKHQCHLAEVLPGNKKAVSVGGRGKKNCADVRMLTMGHSFGGLVTYRALTTRLMTGVAETFRQNQSSKDLPYAYSFGDLMVLVNPAFEGTRFEPLAEAALNRKYQSGDEHEAHRTAQLPILIVATSEGDWVTHWTFPIFRFFTPLFESTRDQTQNSANLNTVGWTDRYQTHKLSCGDGPSLCANPPAKTFEEIPPKALMEAINEERAWYEAKRHDSCLRVFNNKSLDLADGLRLTKVEPDPARPDRPEYMPLWVVQADANIIHDHNDFLSWNFTNFLRQIYYVILGEEDAVMVRVLDDSPKSDKPSILDCLSG